MNNKQHAGKILHLHIPKTAGTALRQYFSDQVGESEVSPSILGLRLGEALTRWSHITVVSGHFVAYQGDRLPADYLCITVLRDPLDRFLSEYYFLKYGDHGRPIGAQLPELDLDGYIAKLSDREEFYLPAQIQMLYPYGAEYDRKLPTDEKLHAAKRAIDMLDLVGVQDELEDFEHMISAQMGWRPRAISKLNVTPHRTEVAELAHETSQRLHRLLEPEIELYHHARERFRRDRRRYIVGGMEITPENMDDVIHAGDSNLATPRNFGDLRCEIISVNTYGDTSGPGRVMTGERNTIHIRFVVHEEVPQINIGVGFRAENGSLMYGTNSQLQGRMYKLPPGRYSAQIGYYNRLGIGRYHVDVNLLRTASHHDDCYHWIERAVYFDVHDASLSIFEGRILLDTEFHVHTDSGVAVESAAPEPIDVRMLTFGHLQEHLLDFAGHIEPLAKIERFAHSTDVLIPTRIHNTGSETWKAAGRNQVTLSYRWYSEQHELVVADGLRTFLPADMAPGDSAIVPFLVRTPDQPGRCLLVISLVQEMIAWFADQNPESACELSINTV